MKPIFAFLKDDGMLAVEDVIRNFERLDTKLIAKLFAHFGLLIMKCRQTMHHDRLGFAGLFKQRIVDLIRQEFFDPGLDVNVFSHGDPNIGIQDIGILAL